MVLDLVGEILRSLIGALVALLCATGFFYDFIIDDLAYIAVSVDSFNILAHHAMDILRSQIVAADFACRFICLVCHEPALLLLGEDRREQPTSAFTTQSLRLRVATVMRTRVTI